MATPDKVFKQTFAWYKASIARLLAASAIPAAQKPAVEQLIWQVLGVLNPAAPPVDPDLSDFKDNGAAAESLAVATQVIAEVLAALGYVKRAVDGLSGGSPAAALAVVGPVLDQIDRLTHLSAGSRYPSAFSIGKMLLMLSGDAEADPAVNHEADKLAAILGAASAADIANAQAALGMVSLLVGSMIDRSFTAPTASTPGWIAGKRHPVDARVAEAHADRTGRSRRQPRTERRTTEHHQRIARARVLAVATHRRHQHHARPVGDRWRRRARSHRPARSGQGKQRRVLGRHRHQAHQRGRRTRDRQRRARRQAVGRRARHLPEARERRARIAVLREGCEGDDQARRRIPQADPRRRHHDRSRPLRRSRQVRQAAPAQRHRTACKPADPVVAHRPVRAAADQPRRRSSRRKLHAPEGRSLGIVRRDPRSVRGVGRSARHPARSAARQRRASDRFRVQAAQRHRPFARRGHRQGRWVSRRRRAGLCRRARAQACWPSA